MNSRRAIHREFNLLSQRDVREAAIYRLFAGKMVNATARRRLMRRAAAAGFVAFRSVPPYLTGQGTCSMTRIPVAASPSTPTRPLLLLGAVAGVLGLATLALWAWYGTTVFFEMLRAGLAACF
jgi:hypothetical protein